MRANSVFIKLSAMFVTAGALSTTAIADDRDFYSLPTTPIQELGCFDVLKKRPKAFQALDVETFPQADGSIKFNSKLNATGRRLFKYMMPNGAHIYDLETAYRFERHDAKSYKELRAIDLKSPELIKGHAGWTHNLPYYRWSGDAYVKLGYAETLYGFDMSKFYVSMASNVKLPWWEPAGRMTASDRQKWEKYACYVAEHETLHFEPRREHIVIFLRRLEGLRAGTTDELAQKAKDLWKFESSQSRRKNADIDKRYD